MIQLLKLCKVLLNSGCQIWFLEQQTTISNNTNHIWKGKTFILMQNIYIYIHIMKNFKCKGNGGFVPRVNALRPRKMLEVLWLTRTGSLCIIHPVLQTTRCNTPFSVLCCLLQHFYWAPSFMLSSELRNSQLWTCCLYQFHFQITIRLIK